MGVALHRCALNEAAPSPAAGARYRIVVLGSPKTTWRASSHEAMADAIDMGLASWDGRERVHYLAVPVTMEVYRAEVHA